MAFRAPLLLRTAKVLRVFKVGYSRRRVHSHPLTLFRAALETASIVSPQEHLLPVREILCRLALDLVGESVLWPLCLAPPHGRMPAGGQVLCVHRVCSALVCVLVLLHLSLVLWHVPLG